MISIALRTKDVNLWNQKIKMIDCTKRIEENCVFYTYIRENDGKV